MVKLLGLRYLFVTGNTKQKNRKIQKPPVALLDTMSKFKIA